MSEPETQLSSEEFFLAKMTEAQRKREAEKFGRTDLVRCLFTISEEQEAERFYLGFISFLAHSQDQDWIKDDMAPRTAAALAIAPFIGTGLGMSSSQVQLWQKVLKKYETSMDIGEPVAKGDLKEYIANQSG